MAQPEIERYLQDVADTFNLGPQIFFDTAVESAHWNTEDSRSGHRNDQGHGDGGHRDQWRGRLSAPAFPDLPGMDSFAGTAFHSARWRHDHDLAGRRVGIIGTGASTIQFLPHVQKVAGHLTLFQRTPPWVFPHRNRPTRSVERMAF